MNGLFSNTNFAHCFFGLLSCIPGPVGSFASLADGLVYAFVDKDYGMAAFCFMDVVVFGMSKAATSLLKAKKIENTAQVLLTSSRIMSNAASFGMCANATMATGFAMYDKYYIQGQAIDSDTKWEVASLVMSVVGCVVSGKGILNNSKKLGTMLQHEGFTNTLKMEVSQIGCSVKSTVKGGNYCFVAGTLVHTMDGTKAIEDIQLGDYVLAYNEETGENGYKRVVYLFRNTTEELAHVEVEGTEEIICTSGHKFFVEGEWISAGEMKPGDILTLADGTTAEVLNVTIEKLETPVAIYNFEVEDWHTYYVADSGVLVHNMACGSVNSVSGTTPNFIVSENGIAEAVDSGQHILQRHVGLSDNELLTRLNNNPRISGASTFTDDIIANSVVNSVLNDPRNVSRINNWLSNGATINLPLNYVGNTVVGRGVFRGSNVITDMTNAKVILKSNGMGGYNILTAYPTR